MLIHAPSFPLGTYPIINEYSSSPCLLHNTLSPPLHHIDLPLVQWLRPHHSHSHTLHPYTLHTHIHIRHRISHRHSHRIRICKRHHYLIIKPEPSNSKTWLRELLKRHIRLVIHIITMCCALRLRFRRRDYPTLAIV